MNLNTSICPPVAGVSGGGGRTHTGHLPVLLLCICFSASISCNAVARPFVPAGDEYLLASGTAVTAARSGRVQSEMTRLTDSELAEQLAAYLQLARTEQDATYVGFGLSYLSRLDAARRARPELALAEGDLLQFAHRYSAALAAYELAAADPLIGLQAELRRFVLLMTVGRFNEAEGACAKLQARAAIGYGLACQLWLEGLTRDTDAAIARLGALLPLMAEQGAATGWMREILLDLLLLNGDIDVALAMLESGVLDIPGSAGPGARPVLPVEIVKFTVEHLMLSGHYTDALQLLERAADTRPLVVHRQLLLQLLEGNTATRADTEILLADYLQTEQVDKYKLVALWQFLVADDTRSALAAASASWQVNRYISDAQLLQHLARIEGDRETLAELQTWRQTYSLCPALLGEV